MPSSQAPPAGATALDPTAVRPDIADARIIRVTPAEIRAILEGLQNDGFAMLLDIGGVDYPGREPARFDVVYHLLKLPARIASVAEVGTPERVRVLCGVTENDPVVPTVTDLWPSADWAEREIFDLYGISFSGHPDLRRIQMPDDWEGYPLRKDYPLRGVAHERTPRPSFALKSNVAAGTPASGRTAAALQKQIAQARGRNEFHGAADLAATAQSGKTPGGAMTGGAATAEQLAERPHDLNQQKDDTK
ncbi:MAG: NADH-quinone oxidoreductase subunit [Candidatus Eremiobacteraeota bacterium]|nr:NADH-quinone oxidoreductase subunit [Candidatus Eremiobacteraeota bacterium]MEA2721957.1 NADH-quinone oxidoreductase subunit [Candidatus Eremiobacteraeota bacterium]